MTHRPHRFVPRVLAGLAIVAAAACAGNDGNAGGQTGTESSLTSPCGVVVVASLADANYCAHVRVLNNGTTSVRHWSLDVEVAAGIRVDFIDTGTYTQSGTRVHIDPDAAHATMNPTDAFEVTICNSDALTLTTTSPSTKSELCSGTIDAGPGVDVGTPIDSGLPGIDTGTPSDSGTTTTDSGTTATDSGKPPTDTGPATDAGPTAKTALGKYVMTWYSFQDNTPVNSSLSASGRKLFPYISVAVPFRLLKSFGGKLNYGDHLYLEFLDGRTMPNGTKHTGWVQIDDFCGDSGDDSYCFQTVGGTKYPNVDLYLGDFSKSGMDLKACSGPAGSGQELTNVSTGTPGASWIADYGGKALGSGKCGDAVTAKAQQGACWDYTPPASSASECAGCTAAFCTSW